MTVTRFHDGGRFFEAPIYFLKSSRSLLVNLSHTDESCETKHVSVDIYALHLLIEHSGEH